MAIYKEDPSKLTFASIGPDQPIVLSIKCFDAVGTAVSFGEFDLCECNGSANIPSKGSVTFKGATKKLGKKFKVVHTFKQKHGDKVSYAFPDDYKNKKTPYDPKDEHVSYEFTLNIS